MGRLEGMKVDVDLLAAGDGLAHAARDRFALRRGCAGAVSGPVDAENEIVDVRRVACRRAALEVLEKMLDRGERARPIPREAAIGHEQVDDAAVPEHAVPLGEGRDGIRDVFEDVRGRDVVERVVAERQ